MMTTELVNDRLICLNENIWKLYMNSNHLKISVRTPFGFDIIKEIEFYENLMDKWLHVIVLISEDNISIYLNGKQILKWKVSVELPKDKDHPFIIGTHPMLSSFPTNALFYKFKFYNYLVDTFQMLEDFSNIAQQLPPLPPNYWLHFKSNEKYDKILKELLGDLDKDSIHEIKILASQSHLPSLHQLGILDFFFFCS